MFTSRTLLRIVLACYVAYAALFIYQTSFIVNGERFFSLFDDAMVSMRYARNFAEGHGLVWNPGDERVEGYTNLLWVLLMAAFHMLPVPPSKVSVLVQGSGALFLAANIVLVSKLAEELSGGSRFAIGSAVILTALYLPLNNWALQGMEVSALALLITGTAWLLVRQVPRAGPRWWWPYGLLGVGTFIRLDVVVLFGAVILFNAWTAARNRWRHLIVGCSILAVCVMAQTVFRWAYYGDVLPNTYYLKMTGYPPLLRITRGFFVFLDFLFRSGSLVVLIPLGTLIAFRDRRLLLLAAIISAQVVYSIYVGGDAWEWWGGSNRYISVVMPLCFVIMGCGFSGLHRALESSLAGLRNGGYAQQWLVTGGVAVIASLTVVQLNAIDPNAGQSLTQWTLYRKPIHVADNKDVVEMALAIKDITTPNAKVAVFWAGAAPYFMDRFAVDLLGKNDRVIARLPMRLPPWDRGKLPAFQFFVPGHLKLDVKWSISHYEPDVVTLGDVSDDEAPILLSDYTRATVGRSTIPAQELPRCVLGKARAPIGDENGGDGIAVGDVISP